MKALIRKITAAATAAAVCFSSGALTVLAITPDTVIVPSYKNEQPQSGCVKASIVGNYTADIQNALDRINEIRLEACKKGYPDPGNPSEKLTVSDYLPIKWSASLESEARVRAAEATVCLSHTRPNGKSPFTLQADDLWDCAEVLAWNGSSTIVSGIEQFYGERDAWVQQDSSAVTGHYTSMIDPDITHVGMSAFQSDSFFGNTVAARFGIAENSDGNKPDETRGKSISNCAAEVIIKNSYLSNPRLVKVGGSSSLTAGSVSRYELRADSDIDGTATELILHSGTKWSSSNPVTATVDKFGKITAKSAGKVTITAVCGSFKASKSFVVTDSNIKNASVKLTSGSSFTYSGKAVKPSVTVKLGGKTLKNNSDYTVSYKNNVKTGKASCIITGKGRYKGSKTVYFYIKPKKQTITQITKPAKGKIKLRWKKDPQADGVQIFYALNSKYSGKKSLIVKGSGKTAKTVSGLKSGKTYYLKLRSFKIVDGKKLCGSCCKTVKVRTK